MDARVRWFGVVLVWVWSGLGTSGFAATRQPWNRRPGVLLYHVKASASAEERTAFGRLLTSQSIHSTPAAVLGKSVHALAFPQRVGDEEQMAEELMASGAVDFAEPDYLMPAAAMPDDPQFSSQWFHQTIHSPLAWTYTTGNPSVLVAVCDTGIDSSHPDLSPNLSLPGFNVVDTNADTSPVAPHGTEVAGVLGAVGNNSIGITGMNWGVKILPVRITDNADTTAYCSDMASGIEWAADHSAKVINLSYETRGCPATIETASAYAKSLGALVVVAAGNGALDISTVYPAARSFLLIGATDSSDQQVIFSNYGSAVSLGAPGKSIFTTQPGGYGTVDGTSFSAPLVSGVAALIYSLNPSWSSDVVQNLMLASAKPLSNNLLGYGRLDAGAALVAAENCLTGNCPTPAPLGNSPQGGPPATVTTSNANSVRAYPNPWRSDKHQAIPMIIDHLSPGSDLKIFTISAELVRRLTADSTGAASWDLTNTSGERVASGVYLFLSKDAQGQASHGKLAVIR